MKFGRVVVPMGSINPPNRIVISFRVLEIQNSKVNEKKIIRKNRFFLMIFFSLTLEFCISRTRNDITMRFGGLIEPMGTTTLPNFINRSHLVQESPKIKKKILMFFRIRVEGS